MDVIIGQYKEVQNTGIQIDLVCGKIPLEHPVKLFLDTTHDWLPLCETKSRMKWALLFMSFRYIIYKI